jgi:beta-lactamase regulating signal transducer with metallopeptidase domain
VSRRGQAAARTVGAVPRPVQALATDVAARLGIKRFVRVVGSRARRRAGVVGWLKPIVMLPASAIVGLSPAQIESILAHELAT